MQMSHAEQWEGGVNLEMYPCSRNPAHYVHIHTRRETQAEGLTGHRQTFLPPCFCLSFKFIIF